jgi:hypothetical protein
MVVVALDSEPRAWWLGTDTPFADSLLYLTVTASVPVIR